MPDDLALSILVERLWAEIEGSLDAALDHLAASTPELAPPAAGAVPGELHPAGSPDADPPPEREDYDPLFDRQERRAAELASGHASQAAAAGALWRELAGHPPARRLILVRHQRRLQTWGLFDRLLWDARRLAPGDPREARRRLDLALALLAELHHPWLTERLVEDLRAACLRGLAEVAELLGETARAAQLLGRARRAFAAGTGDLLEQAHLLRLRARLAAGAARSADAARWLDAARAIFRRLRQTDLEAQTLLDRARLSGHRDPRLGAALLRDAAALCRPAADPRLALSIQHQLAWFLNELAAPAGGPFAARRLVAELRPAYLAGSDAATTIHRRWLEGRILRNLEHLPEAAQSLTQTVSGLASVGDVQNLILCALDLLELHVHAGDGERAARVGLMGRDSLPAWGAPEEAVAAWARAVESRGDRAVCREVALLFREQGNAWLGKPRRRGGRRKP